MALSASQDCFEGQVRRLSELQRSTAGITVELVPLAQNEFLIPGHQSRLCSVWWSVIWDLHSHKLGFKPEPHTN